MAGCGYVCPICEGRGFLEDGRDCDFCSRPKSVTVASLTPPGTASLGAASTDTRDADRETWIAQVHEGSCCADYNER